MLTTGHERDDQEIEPLVHLPVSRRRGPRSGRVVLGVVVGEVEIGVGAVEDDDVEVRVLLDQADELGELWPCRRGDRVDRGVVERRPGNSPR